MTFRKADFEFCYGLRVRYAEVDAQRVVFNAHYLTYFDVAITEFMRFIDYDYLSSIEGMTHDFHLVKATVEFKAPLRFDDVLAIGVRAGRVGRTSINWELAIFRNEMEEAAATGEIVWVYVDMVANRSTPLPEALRVKLSH